MSGEQMGPTVVEAAWARYQQIGREIEALQEERRACARRMAQYRDSKMLEAERIATTAEAFQRTPLPES